MASQKTIRFSANAKLLAKFLGLGLSVGAIGGGFSAAYKGDSAGNRVHIPEEVKEIRANYSTIAKALENANLGFSEHYKYNIEERDPRKIKITVGYAPGFVFDEPFRHKIETAMEKYPELFTPELMGKVKKTISYYEKHKPKVDKYRSEVTRSSNQHMLRALPRDIPLGGFAGAAAAGVAAGALRYRQRKAMRRR